MPIKLKTHIYNLLLLRTKKQVEFEADCGSKRWTQNPKVKIGSLCTATLVWIEV